MESLDGIRSHDTPSLSLIIKNGMIELFTGTESQRQVTALLKRTRTITVSLTQDNKINDSKWHTVNIKFNRGSVSLELDDFYADYVSFFTLFPNFNFFKGLHKHWRGKSEQLLSWRCP